jgi:hypothetical protein
VEEEEEAGEPEIKPLSLAELGLSEEEIAALQQEEGGEPAAPAPAPEEPAEPVADMTAEEEEAAALFDFPEPSAVEEEEEAGEPEIKPLSLAELGLSEEEIAALQQEEGGEPAAPAQAEPPAEVEAEEDLEIEPFSLEGFGFDSDTETGEVSEAEPAAEYIDEDDVGLTPFSLDNLDISGEGDEFEAAEEEKAEPEPAPVSSPSRSKAPETQLLDDVDIQPFSLDDLGLDDTTPFNLSDIEDSSDRLSLTADELSSLDDLGGLVSSVPGASATRRLDIPEETMPDTGDPALDKLIVLGQRQGFVDLTDIINVVEDPVAESERIEDIGRALHRAGIEIRDGDEVIDMEEVYEDYEDEYYDDTYDDSSDVVDEDTSIAPLSLEELGLSEEEINSLGLAEADKEGGKEAPGKDEAISDVSPSEADIFGDVLDSFDIPEPAASQPAPSQPAPSADEPEIAPLSLAELGLSEEEIAMLGIGGGTEPVPFAPSSAEPDTAMPPAVPDEPAPADSDTQDAGEPEIAPLSLAELGLSEEEIAALGLEAGSEAPAAEEPQAEEPQPAAEAPSAPSTPSPAAGGQDESEAEIAPLSLQELGLSEEEIALLGLSGESEAPAAEEPQAEEPQPAAEAPTPPPAAAPAAGGQDEGEAEIAPLSLQELGLSEEEIALLGLGGESETPAAEPQAEEPQPSAEAPSTPSPSTPAPAAGGQDEGEAEIAPLSLQELGLTDEEIAMLGFGGGGELPDKAEKPETAEPEHPVGADIPSFSLEELGLTEEEVSRLGGLAASSAASSSSAGTEPAARSVQPPSQKPSTPPPREAEDLDEFDFDIAEQHKAEIAPAKRTRPRQEEEEPAPASPEDLAFVPEPLEALDDIWDLPDTEPDQAPARVTIDRPAQPVRDEQPAHQPVQEHGGAGGVRRSVISREASPGGDRRRGGRRGSRPAFRPSFQRDETAHQDAQSGYEKVNGEAVDTHERPTFIPTGNEELDEYLRQLEDDPSNEGLAMVIAHFGMEVGCYEVAMYHYKHLIKQGMLLDEVLEDLLEQIQGIEDQSLVKKFHRLIGDVYIKQKRFSEAMAAYKGKL